ncbi:MAG: DUF4832 domain-containing protein [Candidatus Zipacnadales bacterium]
MRLTILTCVGLCSLGLGAKGVSQVVVTPTEIDDLLPNPHMGWQTFHCFADTDPNLGGLPSSSAYFRFYWSEIESEEGHIDFAKFEELLAKAHAAGQKLAFRIMCAGTDRAYMHVPQWLKDKGCPGFEFRYENADPLHWVPDMNSSIFQEAHFRMIAQLGQRLDGHPDLDLIDIGSVGLWGEWHMSGTGVEMPSWETRRAIIDAWCAAFPKTPKVMLIGDAQGMSHATGQGCGWRADCLGDMGGFSKTWNHMEHFYRQQLAKTGAEEAWKTAPVAFESCWDMRKWHDEGWDIRYIFDYALDLHASYLNNKSAPLPPGCQEEIDRFLRKLGYRLVLRRLEHPVTVTAGADLQLSMEWENIGVAPPYHDHMIAIRLEPQSGGRPTVLSTEESIKGWLPGKHTIETTVSVPVHLPPGTYDLALGIVDPAGNTPRIRLAIAGRDQQGWYPLSKVELT